MLSEIPWKNFLEWREYRRLAVPGDVRADYRSAQIVEALYTIAVKGNAKWTAEDFLLHFGDDPKNVPTSQPKQSIEQQTRLLDTWIFGSNAVFAQKPAS